MKGFCNSSAIDRVRELDYVLTPGRYAGLPDEKDDFDFNERCTTLKKGTIKGHTTGPELIKVMSSVPVILVLAEGLKQTQQLRIS
ncbi:MAG: hypothetical protein KAR32_00300 [Candidatus Omnitrophica bacterium]|nr:hypothetical protein [Candidatus Omnitrophota bacterium]